MTEPRIETERLILRLPQLGDLPRWIELMGDPECTRYIGGVKTENLAWRAFMAMAGAWSLTGISMFSLIEKNSGRWVGRCGPWYPAGWPEPEIGWSLHRDAWGHGYATEAGHAAVRYAFEQLGWERLIHVIDPQNQPSIRVAQRLGSESLGPCTMPPPYDSAACEMWGQTREQWKAGGGDRASSQLQ